MEQQLPRIDEKDNPAGEVDHWSERKAREPGYETDRMGYSEPKKNHGAGDRGRGGDMGYRTDQNDDRERHELFQQILVGAISHVSTATTVACSVIFFGLRVAHAI